MLFFISDLQQAENSKQDTVIFVYVADIYFFYNYEL